MNIIDLEGNTLIEHDVVASSNKGKMTQAQAGAVMVSEIDIAIERWNKAAIDQVGGEENKENAHILEFKFEQKEYAKKIQETQNLFGCAVLSIQMAHKGRTDNIYLKAMNFAKENQLLNTNGYFPTMIVDCLGFLLASGFMYNLALSENRYVHEQKNTKAVQPKPGVKGKPGRRPGRKLDKKDS